MFNNIFPPKMVTVVDKVVKTVEPEMPQMRIYEGRTGSHEQLFLHANWGQQTKESAVVDGTSCCVIL